MRVKTYITIAIVALLLLLLSSISYLYKKNSTLKKELIEKTETVKSYENENSDMSDIIITQKREIGELVASRDSINRKLSNTISELKLKEKKISELQYLSQTATKVDSIYIRDSIFIKDFSLDTTLADKWYKLSMKLEYPNLIVVNPEFNSELHIIKHTEKEYVGERKKCFILRWFQKKILVEKVEVVEKNPYINTTFYRDVEIIK